MQDVDDHEQPKEYVRGTPIAIHSAKQEKQKSTHEQREKINDIIKNKELSIRERQKLDPGYDPKRRTSSYGI